MGWCPLLALSGWHGSGHAITVLRALPGAQAGVHGMRSRFHNGTSPNKNKADCEGGAVGGLEGLHQWAVLLRIVAAYSGGSVALYNYILEAKQFKEFSDTSDTA